MTESSFAHLNPAFFPSEPPEVTDVVTEEVFEFGNEEPVATFTFDAPQPEDEPVDEEDAPEDPDDDEDD
jgi:hypothetical protein